MEIKLINSAELFSALREYAKRVHDSKRKISGDIYQTISELNRIINSEILTDVLKINCTEDEIHTLLSSYIHSLSTRKYVGIFGLISKGTSIECVKKLKAVKRFSEYYRALPNDAEGASVTVYVFFFNGHSIMNPDYALRYLFTEDFSF